MEFQVIVEAITQAGAIAALAIWIAAERRDNAQLWSIIESLVKLRLRQFEENSTDAMKELE